MWEYSCKGLQLAQLLGQLGIFLTWPALAATKSGMKLPKR
jgi:hypothetical protein